MKDYIHIPIMLNECIEALQIKEDGVYVDCTTNRGGHSLEIIKRLRGGGQLICIDLDKKALDEAAARLEQYFIDNNVKLSDRPRITFVNKNYRELENILNSLAPSLEGRVGVGLVDGILADLGISSEELDISGRGFTFQKDEPLYMTFQDIQDVNDDVLTAQYIVNNWSEETIKAILWGYADEAYRGRIARAIVEAREKRSIETTGELVKIIESVVPKSYKNKKGPHFATRTFQALRMATNDELNGIVELLQSAKRCLKVGGRMAIITFHSTEDRTVKLNVRELGFKLVNKKPIVPSDKEMKDNTRSRSAKLRIISN